MELCSCQFILFAEIKHLFKFIVFLYKVKGSLGSTIIFYASPLCRKAGTCQCRGDLVDEIFLGFCQSWVLLLNRPLPRQCTVALDN